MAKTAYIPPVVYHYTSLPAMMSIVENECIWATSIEYLNDLSERKLLLERVQARLVDFQRNVSHNLTNTWYEDGRMYLDDLLGTAEGVEHLPFVASFSSEPDSLMQWRSYCPNLSGVSIGFNTASLLHGYCKGLEEPHFLEPKARFAPVQYLAANDEIRIKQEMNRCYDEAKRIQEHWEDYGGSEDDNDDAEKPTLADSFQQELRAAASFYKSKSFEGEQEFRLLLGSIADNMELLRFRSVRSTLIPYVELAFGMPRAAYMPLVPKCWQAINQVIVGPTSNMRLTTASVKAFLLSKRIDVPVRESKVTYRDW